MNGDKAEVPAKPVNGNGNGNGHHEAKPTPAPEAKPEERNDILRINATQWEQIQAACEKHGVSKKKVLAKFGVNNPRQLSASFFTDCMAMIARREADIRLDVPASEALMDEIGMELQRARPSDEEVHAMFAEVGAKELKTLTEEQGKAVLTKLRSLEAAHA